MNSHEFRIDRAHSTDGDFEILACPLCDSNWLHFDEVHVGGRPQEHGEFVNVIVNDRGSVRERVRGGDMARPVLGDMNRHYLSLVAWCETCGERFAYAFVQHKGHTKLQLISPQWRPLTGG